jgi:hypothetical protein
LVWSKDAEKDPSHPGQYEFEGVYLMPTLDKPQPEEPVSADDETVDSIESTTIEPTNGVDFAAPAPGSESPTVVKEGAAVLDAPTIYGLSEPTTGVPQPRVSNLAEKRL